MGTLDTSDSPAQSNNRGLSSVPESESRGGPSQKRPSRLFSFFEIDRTIMEVAAVFTTLVGLGGAGFAYLRTEIKSLKNELKQAWSELRDCQKKHRESEMREVVLEERLKRIESKGNGQ